MTLSTYLQNSCGRTAGACPIMNKHTRKTSKRPEKGRALLYHRDSGGQHEMTPGQYVGWAAKRSGELGITFHGTADIMEAMIREGRYTDGDIFCDYGVKGNTLSRNGLDALIREIETDAQISHILIPRRDRLARPDDPLDGVKLENTLRRLGIAIVFTDKVCPPLAEGSRQDVGDAVSAFIDYHRGGQERRDLAEKIIYAQLALAKGGYSTGGRASYGFARWLIAPDGTRVRALNAGERVRMAGHHVVWLPGSDERFRVGLRILDMLDSLPASRVATILTAEGIPSPDAGRQRKDGGLKHPVSGVWHGTTITNIARNPL